MNLKLLKLPLILVVFSLFFVGCSKSDSPIELDDPKNPPGYNDNSLKSFSFSESINTNLNSKSVAVIGGEIIYITVEEGADLTKLIPSFSIADGATATIDGKEIVSDATTVDFSKTVTLKVTASGGTSRYYTVLAKNGIAKIDNKVYSFMIDKDVPGMSGAFSKDEEIVYVAAYGFADVEAKERVTPDHKFRLASMSKQHTTIAIMTLMEKGLLTLNDQVFGKEGILSQYGDNFPDNRIKYITVRHLLEHTSGYSSDCIFASGYSGLTLDETIQKFITNTSLAYNPGSTHDYSNFGFSTLGKIVEVVSGKDFETYLKEEIYSQMGIKNICGGKNEKSERVKPEVVYYGQDGKDAYGNDVEKGIAAGGIIATATDLMTLMAHIDYGTKVPDILKREILDLMYTPSKPNDQYALGWRVNHSTLQWACHHGGTLAGVAPIWARGFDNRNGVLMCNSRAYNANMDTDLWVLMDDIRKMF